MFAFSCGIDTAPLLTRFCAAGSSAIQLATDLTMIGNDFMARAERIGRVIIEELFLPEHQQTLKPIRDRGQLGGLKYIVQDIFFKIGIGEGPPFSADRTVSDPVWAASKAGAVWRGLRGC